MHFLWALLFKWFAFSPNLLHLIPSLAHIKLRTWLGFNSILDFVCAFKMSWISPINGSFSFWALDLVICPLRICKASFELFICASAWDWLNFSSWFSSAPLWWHCYQISVYFTSIIYFKRREYNQRDLPLWIVWSRNNNELVCTSTNMDSILVVGGFLH